MGEEGKVRAAEPYLRLSAERRDRFLEVLGQTGNRRFAAAAIGVEPRLMDQRRKYDRLLDRQWREALAQAHRRLSGADGPFDCIGARELNVITRGRGGQLKLVASGGKRWSKAVEDRFLAALGVTGNIAGAARSVGYNESCVWKRRRKWPDFARRMEEALEDAEVALEFRLVRHANNVGGEAGPDTGLELAAGTPGADKPPSAREEAAGFDADFAFRFLKWREQKRQGAGPRGRRRKGPPERTFEQARASILAKIEAIERHEGKYGKSSDTEGGEAPPGDEAVAAVGKGDGNG